jgi:hypothetical protein
MNARNLVATTALFFLAHAARAQEVNLARLGDPSANHVQLTTGAEYGLVAGVGYARAVPLAGRTVLLGADLSLPWAHLASGDWRARATALAPIAGGDGWTLAGMLAPVLRESSSDADRMWGLGLDLGVLGGYYAPGWFVSSELGFDWEIATHISHSDAYRQLVYADARDGWYSTPGGNFRLGLQAGLSFSRYDLVLRTGRLRSIQGDGPPMFPFYGTLSIDARW